jgi:hypothetical protein
MRRLALLLIPLLGASALSAQETRVSQARVVGSVGPDPDPRGAGFEIRATVEDSLGNVMTGVAITVRVSGGRFAGRDGGCCESTRTPANGTAVWGWFPAGPDTVVITAPDAVPWTGTVAPPEPAPPPPPTPAQMLPAPIVQSTDGVQATPPELLPALGPLVMGGSSALSAFDQQFRQYENRTQCRGNACVRSGYASQLEMAERGAANLANHYGALRGRLQFSIRHGQPWGPQAIGTHTFYGRGRDILKRYLQWAKPHGHAEQAHNNTGLLDIEALWLIEGDTAAWNHLHAGAIRESADPWGYHHMVNPNADPRQSAIALQAFSAAHRLGIPYSPLAGVTWPLDERPGSWKAQGERLISWWLDGDSAYVHPERGRRATPSPIGVDGSAKAPACRGCEMYFQSAMMATELLRWSAYVEPHPRAEQAACLMISHMIEVKGNAAALPFASNRRPPAPDLAGFYVYPALVCWQITGDSRYHQFALHSINALRDAYMWGGKQNNEAWSTGVQNADALLRGIPWR